MLYAIRDDTVAMLRDGRKFSVKLPPELFLALIRHCSFLENRLNMIEQECETAEMRALALEQRLIEAKKILPPSPATASRNGHSAC